MFTFYIYLVYLAYVPNFQILLEIKFQPSQSFLF